MQRNLRPPVFTSVNRIGLRHFGQVGGGIFLGMAAHLGSGGSVTELSVTDGYLGSGGDEGTLSARARESTKFKLSSRRFSAGFGAGLRRARSAGARTSCARDHRRARAGKRAMRAAGLEHGDVYL